MSLAHESEVTQHLKDLITIRGNYARLDTEFRALQKEVTALKRERAEISHDLSVLADKLSNFHARSTFDRS